jgi:hypothetical protein
MTWRESIVRLGQRRVFVARITFPAGARRLQDHEAAHAGLHLVAAAPANNPRPHRRLASRGECMPMRLAIDSHALPVLRLDLGAGAFHLLVAPQKVLAEREAEAFDFFAEMLLRQHVDRVLDRVGRDDFAVVRIGVGAGKIAGQKRRDIHFFDRVRRAVAQNLQHPDASLAVAIFEQLHAGIAAPL